MSADVIHVRDAETALLGAVLNGVHGPAGLDGLLDVVNPADFYHPAHEQVWHAIARVHRGGNQPDPVSVRLALPAADREVVLSLMGGGEFVADPTWHAERVTTAAGMRRVVDAGTKIAAMPDPGGDLEEVRERARAALDEACEGRSKSRARTLAEILPGVLDAAQNGTGIVLPTGWDDLNRSIGGLAPGRMVVFAARPGGGKSIAGTNLALQVAHEHKHGVLLVSLEMPEREVVNRLISAHAKVNLTDLENSTVSDSSWDLIARKAQEIEDMPITIIDDAGVTVQGIRKHARDFQRTRDDLALIVVDYLQLVTPDPTVGRRGGNRAEEVTAVSRGLKQLARETGACVVAMAQVNREGGNRDAGPTLTDLREGGIENDADQVILLHRPDPESPDIVATTAKNRHGPQGVCKLRLQGHYARLLGDSWSPSNAIERKR